MTLRNLPELKHGRVPETCAFAPDEDALQRWNAGIRAEQTPDNTITILDVIGEDWWTGEGVTSKRVAAALRQIGEQEVFVDINSPGGDFFEGVAIYNLLRAHKHKVTVRILGLAASAASVIAMAGDRIEIGKAGFMMVHKAWTLAVGNEDDLLEIARTLSTFDASMVEVYADRSGKDAKAVQNWLIGQKGDGTWFNGESAVAEGLADALLTVDTTVDAQASAHAQKINAVKRVDAALRNTGMSRSERRSLLGEIKGGTQDAAAPATQDAGTWIAAARQLIETMRSKG